MPEHSRPCFEVVYSERLRRRIRALGARAARRGIPEMYLGRVRLIQNQLATDPLNWGDPMHRLRHLGLLVFHRLEGPLQISYAVDERRRIVYLRTIKPMPHQELDDEP